MSARDETPFEYITEVADALMLAAATPPAGEEFDVSATITALIMVLSRIAAYAPTEDVVSRVASGIRACHPDERASWLQASSELVAMKAINIARTK